MFLIRSATDNPYFNIATEEYLLKNFKEDILFLYINKPSIIVGKHQNTFAEINLKHVLDNNIPVIRRLSGGGTVYHDKGNLNFTFIKNGQKGKLIDFKGFTKPIIDFLKQYGADAYLGEKNEIRIGKYKISGNAEHIYKDRVLHHGTLLFNSDLTKLNDAIKVQPDKYQGKAVQSNRTIIDNIVNILPQTKQSISQFSNDIADYIKHQNSSTTEYFLSEKERQIVTSLIEEKYSTWNWNYGYSPSYSIKGEITLDETNSNVILHIEKGVISNIETEQKTSTFEKTKRLIGKEHNYFKLRETLLNDIFPDINEAQINQITLGLF